MRTGHDPDDMEPAKYELAKAFSWRFPGLAGSYAACSGMWKDCAEARYKEAWEEIVEGKSHISSFRTCTK